MPGKRARRFLRFLLWVVVLLVLIAVTVPLWFPWVMRPVAKRFGATFQGYERLSYSGFAVTGLDYSNRNVRVRARRLAVAPLRGYAEARDWAVTVSPSGRRSTNAPRSVHTIYGKVSKIVSDVQHRLPRAALTNGYVETPAVTVHIPVARWSGPDVSGMAQISNALPFTTVRAKLPPSGPIVVELSNRSLELHSSLMASNTAAGLFITMENHWRTNAFSATVTFATNGALPEGATLAAKSALVPPVKGDISATWERGRYTLDAKGALIDHPISFTARVSGDPNLARVQSSEVITPWATVKVQGEVSLSQRFAHHGSAVVQELRLPHTKPFEIAVDWSGERLHLTNIHLTAVAGATQVAAQGAADLISKLVQITSLTLGTNKLDFTADVHWPHVANVCAQLTNFSAQAIDAFVALPYENIFFDHLRFTGGWTNGPVVAHLDFRGHTMVPDGTRLGAEGALAAGRNGVTLTNLSLTRNSEPVSFAHGFLPVLINPTTPPHVVSIRNRELRLHARADPNAFFWKQLEDAAAILVREPEAQVDVSGNWEQPSARVTLRAGAISFRGAAPEVPPLDSVAALAHMRKDGVEIEFLNFFVTNQPVTFSARMPVPSRFWTAPRTNLAMLDWRDLSCRLRIDSAQIAAFSPLIPPLIAPQGIIDADIGLVPGGRLDGQLRIDGASTRTLPSLGALQDIEVLCRFAGDKARVNAVVALGGYSVLGAGEAHIDPNEFLRRRLPPFQFHITGENVPLSRQVDAIVRADVDITIKHGPGDGERADDPHPALISGRLSLRDSLYLRELRDLIPGRLASADRRPPYFTMKAEPFANWRLDLAAAGQRFLKVRTPIFNGEVSADLKLFGTLGEPVATGDVIIDSGTVRFPFGTIAVSQGIISLTSDNPYRPQLLITGNDRVLGYDINMELTGYADAPVLQFSSTPPLNSDQILLMLTAGEIPRQGQFAFTTGQRAQRLAIFFGRGMLSDLGIGDDSNRLTIRTGEHFTETGQTTYSVEYELTDDWSVIGQYDRFNDFNLMLRWRVYSR